MKRILVGASLVLNAALLVFAIYLWLGNPFRAWVHPRVSASATSFFDEYAVESGDIVFLGDSITAGGHWNEMFPGFLVRNRGIGGDLTDDLLKRLDSVVASPVAKVFLMIGTNDLGMGISEDILLDNYARLLDRIMRERPETQIYIQSLLPRAAAYRERVESVNAALRSLAAERGLVYVDLYPAFLADDGSICDEYSGDELHLTGVGYREWERLLDPFVR